MYCVVKQSTLLRSSNGNFKYMREYHPKALRYIECSCIYYQQAAIHKRPSPSDILSKVFTSIFLYERKHLPVSVYLQSSCTHE